MERKQKKIKCVLFCSNVSSVARSIRSAAHSKTLVHSSQATFSKNTSAIAIVVYCQTSLAMSTLLKSLSSKLRTELHMENGHLPKLTLRLRLGGLLSYVCSSN